MIVSGQYILMYLLKELPINLKLKYRLKRDYLEQIYLVFIRPILEYASEVWDNFGQTKNTNRGSCSEMK